MRGAFEKSGLEKGRSAGQSKVRADEGFKPDAAAGLIRVATTSACVGWDVHNIENRAAFRKPSRAAPLSNHRLRKRLHDHEDDNPDHEQRRHLIDNTIEFLAVRIAIGREGPHPTGEKTVDRGEN